MKCRITPHTRGREKSAPWARGAVCWHCGEPNHVVGECDLARSGQPQSNKGNLEYAKFIMKYPPPPGKTKEYDVKSILSKHDERQRSRSRSNSRRRLRSIQDVQDDESAGGESDNSNNPKIVADNNTIHVHSIELLQQLKQ